VDDNLVKIGIIAAIMGALLLGGLALNSATAVQETPPPTETTEVTVIPQETLEMLDPIYSEKAVYEDDTIRISFKASQTENGVESRLPFWLHNVSNDVITVLWDRCSLELPCANTVNIANEAQLDSYSIMHARPISVAPGGDLFDAVIPISEVTRTESGWAFSSDVLDQGPFLFVLAIETGSDCGPRQIRYYPFRFVIR
jgi:hypothetical protein